MNNTDFNNRINQLELLMFDSERDGDSIVFDVQALKAKETELLKRALSMHSDKALKRKHQRMEFISILSSAACIMLIIAAAFVFALRGLSAPSPSNEHAISVALNTPPAKLPPHGGADDNYQDKPSAVPDPVKPSFNSPSALGGSGEELQSDFNTWDEEDPSPASQPEDIQYISPYMYETILAETTSDLSNSKVIRSAEGLSYYISRDYSLTSKIRTDISLESALLSYQYRLYAGYADITYHYINADDPEASPFKVKIPESKPKFVELSGGECVAVYENNKLNRILAVFTKDTYTMTVSFDGVSVDDAIAFLKSLTTLSVR